MSIIQIFITVLFSTALGWVGNRIGLKMLLFSLTGLVTFTAAAIIPWMFTEQLASAFFSYVHYRIARVFVFMILVLFILIPSLYVSRAIEKMLIFVSETGLRVLGTMAGFFLGVIIGQILFM